MERLVSLYRSEYGCSPDRVEKLSGDGSSRQYYRLINGEHSVIGTIGPEKKENEAFLYYNDYFLSKHLPVPRVISVCESGEAYLQEDLGDISLYDIIKDNGTKTPVTISLLENTMQVLARFHAAWKNDTDSGKSYPRDTMDRRAILWDLNYFKYCFVKPAGIDFDEDCLQDEFEAFADAVGEIGPKTLVLRDFQSRNVMIKNGMPYVIDYQGARIGPALYDVASFLWQARIGLTEEERWRYAEVYSAFASSLGVKIPNNWKYDLSVIALFRMLQVLGAYGIRGLIEHKSRFVTPVPAALINVNNLLESIGSNKFPCLRNIIDRALSLDKFKVRIPDGHLTVKVYSFSYKKGIPEDFSGNGGGFVFDCRGMLNPGRFERYRSLTGRDKPVMDFLEEQGEIQGFLESCFALTDKSVKNYIERGFSSLMICFGCTGGQHRSLYCADKMAQHIASLFDCHVQLIHREQNMNETLR